MVHVAYVGNFSLPWCTEVHIARSLRSLGHTVTELQENQWSHDPAGFQRSLENIEWQDSKRLFLFTRTWGETVTVEHLNWLNDNCIPSVSPHLDLYVGLERGGAGDAKSVHNIGRDPFWLTDWVFSADGDPRSQEFFESKGIRHRWMPPAVVGDECYIADVPLERDMVFVGSRSYHREWPYRGQLIEWLETTYGDRFSWHGRPGLPVRGKELNRLYASTRVAVGDSLCLGFTHKRYWSDRIPETMGRGGFLIHPRIDGMAEQGFIDGQTIATYEYGDWGGLRDRIDYYLSHDDEREKIRRAGHELVKEKHTYAVRMERIIETLEEEGAW